MKDRKITFKSLLLLVAFGVLLNFFVQHLGMLGGAAVWAIGIIKPFVIGGVIAFIVNVPMCGVEKFLFPDEKQSFVENILIRESELQDKAGTVLMKTFPGNLFKGKKRQKKRDISRFKRPISLIVTLLLIAAVIAIVFGIVIPQLGDTVMILWESLPGYFADLQTLLVGLLTDYPEIADYFRNLTFDWAGLGEKLLTFIEENRLLQNIFGTASNIVTGVVNVFIGIIFALYLLVQKETLTTQAKKLLYAFLPERAAGEVVRICGISVESFSKFLSGQCTEAVILGLIFFIAMTIFRFPYALLCSVLIGFTALIPVFGAFIGCAVSAFLILMAEPGKTLFFIIMFLILQQLEGQLIYPHVVGNAVGLPSIWVLVAVSVGGSLFGVMGMLFFIPLASVLYTLLREVVYRRLRKRELDPSSL